MAAQPDRRCRHFVRLVDIPLQVRYQAAKRLAKQEPSEATMLLAAAIYPDPEHGEWIAVEPRTYLEAAA